MAYGQGSVSPARKRNPETGELEETGRWRARYYGPDGKRHCRNFATRTEARNFLATQQSDKLRGNWTDPAGNKIRFAKWATQWLKGRHRWGEQARAKNLSLYRNHLEPFFGNTTLGRITALDAQEWIAQLVDKDLSPATIRSCWQLFSGIMRSAQASKLISDAPIGRDIVDLPEIVRKPERFLTEIEVEMLVSVMKPHARALVLTAAYTGCRFQELAGLRSQHLDLDKGKLHVRGVLERTKGDVRYKSQAKTKASWRTISLPPFLVDVLEEHVKIKPESEWIFYGKFGGVLRDSNVRRVLKSAIKRSGIAPLTFHDLRHTHASWLIRDGVQPLAVSRRLGHKSIRTTMDIYGHLFPDFEDGLIETLHQRRDQATQAHESAKVVSLRRG